MGYISAYYPRTQVRRGTGISVQKAVREDGMAVFAGGIGSFGGAEKRFYDLRNQFFERLLPLCEKGSAGQCMERVEKLLRAKLLEMPENMGAACLIGIGENVLYCWKGSYDIRVYHLVFDRVKGESLTWEASGWEIQRAGIESGVGVVMGRREDFAAIDAGELRACLEGRRLLSAEQLERHLEEICEEAGRRSGQTPEFLFLNI